MSKVIDSLERDQLRRVPRFQAGDRVKVHFQVVEGTRRRTQVFEGVVIKRQGSGARETFTVRKSSFGVGVERTFPLHSPKIEKIDVASRGDVRRAKLYYLRDRVGKSARVRERQFGGKPEEIAYVEPDGAFDDQGAQVEAEILPDEGPAADEAGEAPVADAQATAVTDVPVQETTVSDVPADAPEAGEPAEADEAPHAPAEAEADAEAGPDQKPE